MCFIIIQVLAITFHWVSLLAQIWTFLLAYEIFCKFRNMLSSYTIDTPLKKNWLSSISISTAIVGAMLFLDKCKLMLGIIHINYDGQKYDGQREEWMSKTIKDNLVSLIICPFVPPPTHTSTPKLIYI